MIEIASSENGVPLIAVCGICGQTWVRPENDGSAITLAGWFARHHRQPAPHDLPVPS